MAAAAGDAGGPSASVGTSGSAHAKALVFPSGIGQFDVLLDDGALMTHNDTPQAMCASLHVCSRGLASGLTAVPVCAGVRASQITDLCFAMQPGLAERAHVDYHLMASVFGAGDREGRRTRVYVIDGAGMLCVATLDRVLAGSCAQVHTALAGIDVCSATALDGMLVCIRRVRALVMASLGKYALVLVYGLSQHVPAPAACTASR